MIKNYTGFYIIYLLIYRERTFWAWILFQANWKVSQTHHIRKRQKKKKVPKAERNFSLAGKDHPSGQEMTRN